MHLKIIKTCCVKLLFFFQPEAFNRSKMLNEAIAHDIANKKKTVFKQFLKQGLLMNKEFFSLLPEQRQEENQPE